MTSDEMTQAKTLIDDAFDQLLGTPQQATTIAQHARATDGKVFELLVLADLLKDFVAQGYTVHFLNGNYLKLRWQPGEIKRSEPRLVLRKDSQEYAIWHNVEFCGIGFKYSGRSLPLEPDFHELDLVISDADVPDGKLDGKRVCLAIECKDRRVTKNMLREMIGLRRELSMLHVSSQPAYFSWLPPVLIQDPPSHLFLISSVQLRPNYTKISAGFGITIVHRPL